MNISLTPTLEKFVQDKVASGFYNSVSEVIREALRLLIERDTIPQERLDMLKKDIEEALDDLEAGKYRDGHTVMKELMAQYE